jgi:lipid A ethanolaminephosphotransferase
LRTAALIAAVALFLVCADNAALWQEVLTQTADTSHRAAVIGTLFVFQFCLLAALLALAVGRWALRIFSATLLILAAAFGYFMTRYGVVIDASMIRNVFETDTAEASQLLTAQLLLHMLLFGILPAAAVFAFPLRRSSIPADLVTRVTIVVLGVAGALTSVLVNYESVMFWGQAHREVRLLMNPSYPLYASWSFVAEHHQQQQAEAERTPLHARRAPEGSARPVLFVLVVGETARADRFAVNGYARDTTPYTSTLGLINFPHVTACGTSTADSVPCMFSHLTQPEFDHAKAGRKETLTGLLARLGIDVVWRDNNSGCKGVCSESMVDKMDAFRDTTLCDASGCFDDILLAGLEDRLDFGKDELIVLHQRGSHGPAYHLTVPADQKRYRPECESPDIRACTTEALGNAYDNTILYTDLILAKLVRFLEREQRAFDVALLYVSDHGESLGENGIFLHGFPYRFAPDEQTHVPMMLWASDGFLRRNRVSRSCLAAHAAETYSHDNVFYTVLGAFGVSIDEDRPELDLLTPCRGKDTRDMMSSVASTAMGVVRDGTGAR